MDPDCDGLCGHITVRALANQLWMDSSLFVNRTVAPPWIFIVLSLGMAVIPFFMHVRVYCGVVGLMCVW